MLQDPDGSTDASVPHRHAHVRASTPPDAEQREESGSGQSGRQTGTDATTLRTEVDLQAQKLRQSGKECCSAASCDVTHTPREPTQGRRECVSHYWWSYRGLSMETADR